MMASKLDVAIREAIEAHRTQLPADTQTVMRALGRVVGECLARNSTDQGRLWVAFLAAINGVTARNQTERRTVGCSAARNNDPAN
jgi:hypothetical protein